MNRSRSVFYPRDPEPETPHSVQIELVDLLQAKRWADAQAFLDRHPAAAAALDVSTLQPVGAMFQDQVRPHGPPSSALHERNPEWTALVERMMGAGGAPLASRGHRYGPSPVFQLLQSAGQPAQRAAAVRDLAWLYRCGADPNAYLTPNQGNGVQALPWVLCATPWIEYPDYPVDAVVEALLAAGAFPGGRSPMLFQPVSSALSAASGFRVRVPASTDAAVARLVAAQEPGEDPENRPTAGNLGEWTARCLFLGWTLTATALLHQVQRRADRDAVDAELERYLGVLADRRAPPLGAEEQQRLAAIGPLWRAWRGQASLEKDLAAGRAAEPRRFRL